MSRIARLMPTVFGRNIIVFDDFNRANGALGNAVTGQAWDGDVGDFEISANRLRCVGTSAVKNTYINSGYCDVAVQAAFPVVPNGTASASLLLRYADNNNRLTFYSSSSSNFKWALQSTASGVSTTYNTNVSSQNGDVVRVEMKGSSVAMLINGALVLSETISDNTSATIQGIRGIGTYWRIDNFLVEVL